MVAPEFEELRGTLIDCRTSEIDGSIDACLKAGRDPVDIIDFIQNIMAEVGPQFESGKITLPQMLGIASGMQKAMAILKPQIAEKDFAPSEEKVIVMGSVRGEVHDIGKNLCIALFSSCGYDVHDLGTDVAIEDFVEEVRKGATHCGMSSLMTTTMLSMKEVIDILETQGLRDNVIVMVGGAPVTQAYADKIGADIYGETALDTIHKMREFERGDRARSSLRLRNNMTAGRVPVVPSSPVRPEHPMCWMGWMDDGLFKGLFFKEF